MDNMIENMENPSYLNSEKGGTEMKLVAHGQNQHGQNMHANGGNPGPGVCTPEACRTARQRYQSPDLSGSPWHKNKTYFFVALIVGLSVWIAVYSTLTHYNML